jgi:hypothetical protein
MKKRIRCQNSERMSPKRTKQSSITSMGFPLLKKPAEMCVGRQIKVLGSYWKGLMSNEETNSLYLCTRELLSQGYKVGGKASAGITQVQGSGALSRTDGDEELEDFIRLAREVMQQELQESCFDKKISNSRLVQVYMSKQPGMDAKKVLEKQYITAETFVQDIHP